MNLSSGRYVDEMPVIRICSDYYDTLYCKHLGINIKRMKRSIMTVQRSTNMILRRVYRPAVRPHHVRFPCDVVANSGLCTRASPRFREFRTHIDILANS
jgi:hypothetical protein